MFRKPLGCTANTSGPEKPLGFPNKVRVAWAVPSCSVTRGTVPSPCLPRARSSHNKRGRFPGVSHHSELLLVALPVAYLEYFSSLPALYLLVVISDCRFIPKLPLKGVQPLP